VRANWRHDWDLDVKRNAAWVLLFDAKGREIARLANPHGLDPILAEMRRVRAAQIRGVLDFRPLTKEFVREVERLAEDKAARKRLRSLGAPAYVALSKSPDPELRRMALALFPRHAAVARRGGHRDVALLWSLGKRTRARRILPAAAPAGDPRAWWDESRAKYRWDALRDRYVSKR